MGFIARLATVVAVLAGRSITAPTAATAKYCDASTGVCYSEVSVGVAPITWRIAIPAVGEGPFDVLLQVVAPKTVGWAGLAWGGGMLYNPISLSWANGNSTVASGRFAITWVHNGGAKEALDPGATAASFAFAASAVPPIDPTDPTSPIGIHSEHGLFTVDLAAAKSENFDAWVQQLK